MGFSSKNCNTCGHPLLSQYAIFEGGVNQWMTQAAIIERKGLVVGEFTGYNSVCLGGESDHIINYSANCYHRHCWELQDRPTEWVESKTSDSARDQGYFFDKDDHNYSEQEITNWLNKTKQEFDAWFQATEEEREQLLNPELSTHAERVGANRHAILDADEDEPVGPLYTIDTDDEQFSHEEVLFITGYPTIEDAAQDGVTIKEVK